MKGWRGVMDAMDEVTRHLAALCEMADADGVRRVFLYCPVTLRQVWGMERTVGGWRHSVHLPGQPQAVRPEEMV